MSEEEYDYEEATPEEKLKIASHFILKSPAGQVKDTINDLKSLINDKSILTDSTVKKIMRKYNTEQLYFGESEEGVITMVSKANEVSKDKYLNPVTQKVYKYNQVEQKFEGEEDGKACEHEEIRAAVQKELDSYVEENYVHHKYGTCAHVNEEGLLTVMISSKNLNLKNYWSGGWRSVYTIDVSGSGKQVLSGSIKMNVHYFEQGNVQLNTSYKKDKKVEISNDEETTAKKILKAIDKIETELETNLGSLYATMKTETIKSLRRFLPKTRTTMDWRTDSLSLNSALKK